MYKEGSVRVLTVTPDFIEVIAEMSGAEEAIEAVGLNGAKVRLVSFEDCHTWGSRAWAVEIVDAPLYCPIPIGEQPPLLVPEQCLRQGTGL